MKVFRIVKWLNCYRVDQRHHIMWIFRYWDIGAAALCPTYTFDTQHDAIRAIRNVAGDKAIIYIKVEKFIYYG